jgi:hypothetical protein
MQNVILIHTILLQLPSYMVHTITAVMSENLHCKRAKKIKEILHQLSPSPSDIPLIATPSFFRTRNSITSYENDADCTGLFLQSLY